MKGAQYAELRKARLGLTQNELADRLGISPNTIKRREKSREVGREPVLALWRLMEISRKKD